MVCNKCDNEIDDDSKFCSFCGKRVEKKEETINQIEQNVELIKVDENISNNQIKNINKTNNTTFREFFFSCDGSIGIKEFFFRGVLPLAMLLIFSLTSFFITKAIGETNGFFKFLNLIIVIFWISIYALVFNITVKRLHDVNINGWWAILSLIPLLNFILLIFLLFAPSKQNNVYGLKSEYNLNSKNIFLSIFYVIMVFVFWFTYSISKIIIESYLNEKTKTSFSIEQFKTKIKYLETKDFYQLLDLGFKGDVEAQIYLGDWYYTQKKLDESIMWFEKAANQGHVIALNALGNIYVDRKNDLKKAFEYYEKCANKGFSICQRNLAHRYEYGKGISQDYKKAFEWYEKAAIQGDNISQFKLGKAYNYGNGVNINFSKAKEWYKKACDNGYQISCDYYSKLTSEN